MNLFDKLKDRLYSCMNGIGGIYGVYAFFVMCILSINKNGGQSQIGIKNRNLGKDKFFLRPKEFDIYLANQILGPKSDYLFLKVLFEKYTIENIVDAGANIGLFTRLCTNLNSCACVIAIEPDENNYRMLVKNCFGKNIVALKNGLWNKHAYLRVVPRETGSVGFYCEETTRELADVEAITIPEIMKENKMSFIDLCKIDIEGAEYYLFDESAEYWINCVKIFIIELHERIMPGVEERVIDRLNQHGFNYSRYEDSYVFIK